MKWVRGDCGDLVKGQEPGLEGTRRFLAAVVTTICGYLGRQEAAWVVCGGGGCGAGK